MKKIMYSLTWIVIAVLFFLIRGPLLASGRGDSIESYAKRTYIFATYLKGDDIKIRSEDSVVTLTGTVSEESHKALARETIASLPGVKGVDDQLEVKGEVPLEHSDAWLISQVKSAFFLHRSVSDANTAVTVQDGTVTLRGEASSTAQKDLITEYARDVDGVRDVKNEMTVAMKPGKKTMGEDFIDDVSITAMVKTTLLYHRSTSGLNTTVETKDGVVTLRGRVKNNAEKELAAKIVSDVHGVKEVINDITIE